MDNIDVPGDIAQDVHLHNKRTRDTAMKSPTFLQIIG